ncbi:PAS domain-containing sensor histidine kinase [Geoalkalibacter sp.]|uniref:PAS domain-containing sensor histidine kinase n=1 Tax=Geoalkalibacter sp. TaxID=3041440 RepID=UPI00272E7AEA|nr:ATP-binding protein [Geoalkalibacter sp.]
MEEGRAPDLKVSDKEQRLLLFVEQAPVAIAMFDHDMRYLSASRRWRTDYGLGERALHGLSHYEIFPEIGDAWKAIHRRGLAGEEVAAEEEAFTRADGSIQWLRWQVQPWREASGAIGGIMVFSEDISKRKQAEQDKRESEEEFRVLSEAMPQLVWASDIHGRADYFNSRWFEYTGQSFEEAKNLGWLSALHPEDVVRTQDCWTEAVTKGAVYEVQYRIKGRDGTYRWFLSRGVPRRGASAKIERWIGTCTDISAQKDLEEGLKSAREAAEDASRAKSEFLVTMSHEIRTPMTIFMGAIQHLMEIDQSPEHRQLLEMADSAALRLLTLVDDILDFSRIEARKINIEAVAFDLRACVDEVVRIFALAAQEKNLVLETEVAAEVAERVIGDPKRLGQILVNLVGNAVKFTHAGEIRVGVRSAGEILEFSVTDTGIGIPPEKHSRLFERFSQVDSSLTRRYGGSGLGLAISKGLVELMGGHISVQSAAGKGSRFLFTLPLRLPA